MQCSLIISFQNTDVKIRRSTRRGDLFIILYSIVDRSSFDEAQNIARYIKDHRSNVEAMSIVIVATKKDLDHLRRVDIEEGIALSNEVECTFYEVSISEGYSEVHDLLKEILKRVLKHRNLDKRETLRIPSLGLKRSPSFERRKVDKHSLKNDSDLKGSRERLAKDYVDCQLKPSKSLRDLAEESGTKHKSMSKSSSPTSQRKKNPFSIEKGKVVATANKLQKLDDDVKASNQKVFTLQRTKSGNHANRQDPSRRDQACGHESNDVNNNENKKLVTDRQSDKPKGPFLLNKLHSGSTDKLRRNGQDRPTTSFGRMRVGLERTFGRKKTVYNL